MSVGTLTNVFSVLDSSNVNLIRADEVAYTNTAPTKLFEADIVATVDGTVLTLANYGFGTDGAQCYLVNNGTSDVVLTQVDGNNLNILKMTIPASTSAFIPFFGPYDTTFQCNGNQSVYILCCGS